LVFFDELLVGKIIQTIYEQVYLFRNTNYNLTK
jgi:hypothetical protein